MFLLSRVRRNRKGKPLPAFRSVKAAPNFNANNLTLFHGAGQEKTVRDSERQARIIALSWGNKRGPKGKGRPKKELGLFLFAGYV